jgi:hypothetical protein
VNEETSFVIQKDHMDNSDIDLRLEEHLRRHMLNYNSLMKGTEVVGTYCTRMEHVMYDLLMFVEMNEYCRRTDSTIEKLLSYR